MNKYLIPVILLLVIISGCDLFDNSPKRDPGPKIEKLEIHASDLFTVAGSKKPVTITVNARLTNGDVVSPGGSYSLFANGQELSTPGKFSSGIPGLFSLHAEYEGIYSDTLLINVRTKREYADAEFTIIFHVVHDGEEQGEGYNIPADVVSRQLEMLRQVFSNSDLNYTPNSVSPAMNFKLALSDPEGNELEEPGINRIQRPGEDYSILFEDWMWDHYWDPDHFINVWIGDTKNGYSWGIYPSLRCDSNLGGLRCTDEEYPSKIEGIALELSNLWEGNWVFPHEMGHFFGLFHVFSPAGCISDMDYADDTKNYDRQVYESGSGGNTRKSCDGDSYVSYNVMDYWSQPEGGRDLTYDQVERMRYVVERGRFRASGTPDR